MPTPDGRARVAPTRGIFAGLAAIGLAAVAAFSLAGERAGNLDDAFIVLVYARHLVERGALSQQAAQFLRQSVVAGCNILVSGPTHAGKTTLLNALIAAVRPGERVVTVEETFELDPPVDDIVGLQCRQPSLEGTGEISLRRLVKESLRMRPDRLVVGEVREAEALDLLVAPGRELGRRGVEALLARLADPAAPLLQERIGGPWRPGGSVAPPR